jgi:glycosyltransferase involved in cell wall biosynthesis
VVNEASKKKYDIVHAHANLPGIPGKIIAKKLGIPVIYTVHGSGIEAVKEMYGSLNGSLLYLIETLVQRKIEYNKEISVDSRFLRYKNVNKGISVIPNGVEIKKFDSISVKKSSKFKIIFVGRLHPQKGVKYLIEAVSKIKDKINNVEISIVGSGEEEQRLKKLSKNLGVSDIVKFKGKLFGGDLIKEYKSSNLFVLPSLYEGQPLTLLEAWAAKLPVLVTNTGDNDKFVKNGINGFIVPPKNVSLLSINLLKIIGYNKTNLTKMGLNGYRLVKDNYTWDKMVEKVNKVYENARKIR